MQSITEKLGAPPVLPSVKKNSSLRELSVNITVSTPMVGGGVKAGIVDETRPVRVPSIRGHLRFWWRIMKLNTPGRDAREAEIWGSTENPGTVYAEVREQPSVHLLYCDNNNYFGFDRYGPENYALFSSLPNQKTPGKNIAHENFTFTLNLKYPEKFHDDVRLALSAWLYFGGLGARTRRGCGSLSCDKNPASLSEILRTAKHLTLWRKKANNPMSAWSYSVQCYRDYRQKRNNGQGRHKGRSKWPEADSLRQITGKSLDRHKIPITSPLPSFPRAALGMPIIFHFNDKREPSDVTVIPNKKGSSRMASPVITKALYENGSWYSAVIILPHDDVFDIPLKLDGVNKTYNLPSTKGTIYKNTQPMQGKLDAISGFEEYISGDFKKEAVR